MLGETRVGSGWWRFMGSYGSVGLPVCPAQTLGAGGLPGAGWRREAGVEGKGG